MAQAGTADRWGGRDPPGPAAPTATKGTAKGTAATEGSDEVQRSLELLDSVLSEFDDLENGNLAAGTAPGPPAGTTVLPASTTAALHPARSIRSMAGSGSGSGSGEGEGDLLISSSTPEDDSSPSLSLSLGGHQSEDDGYMSMNGRRNKLALNFRPHNGSAGTVGLAAVRRGSADMLTAPEKPLPPPPGVDAADFPPPPEEAQRLIANLLPRVSPNNSVQRGRAFVALSGSRSSSSIAPARQRQHVASLPPARRHVQGHAQGHALLSPTEPRVTTATQTTLPGTRNQRPFGWEVDSQPPILPPPNRFASLQTNGLQAHRTQQPSWLPPRPATADQLQRTSAGEEEHFSDDSLEDMPPPPPPPDMEVEAVSKRSSIAWEVPLDSDPPDPQDAFGDPAGALTPGSTKVVGRRRRRQSTENYSSSSSLHQDDWPDPPSREHEPTSPSSSCFGPEEDLYESSFLPSSLSASDLSTNGTYVIRKGRKKERKPVRNPLDSLQYNKAKMQLRYADVKRCTYTFDDLDTASDAGCADVVDAAVEIAEPAEASQYPLVRVVSLPSLGLAEEARQQQQQVDADQARRLTLEQQERIAQQEERLIQRLQGLQGLAATPEEDEPSSSLVFNDDHNDDSLEPVANLAMDEDTFRDSNAPLSLIEEQAENGNELDGSAAQIGGRLTSQELDEIAEIQYRKQLPPPPPVIASGDRYTAPHPHADYYNLNKDRIAENCRIADSRDAVNPTKDMYRPRKSASSNDVFSDTKCFPDNSHSLSSTRERDDRPASRRSSNDRRRHHQNMAAEMSSMERWRTAHEMNHVQVVPVVEKVPCYSRNGSASSLNRNTAEKDKKTHTVTVEVNQHDFGPLPPSPVDEFEEDEYSEILHPSPGQAGRSRGKADTLPEPFYQCREPLGSDPSGARYLNRPPEPPPPHGPAQPRDPVHSLKTRSMDAGFTRGFRNASQSSALRRESPSSSERRTLPNDLPGPSHVRRRAFQKRSSSSPQESGLQTSCSLPETPIFARGCDIPRTPHRRAPDVPSGSSGSMRAAASPGTSSSAAGTATRPGGLHTSSYRKMGPGGLGLGLGTGVSLDSGGLGQALVGAELLRLTGGPGRGWYPRHRTPRPASIEHLDRVATQRSPGPWDARDARDARKPMTLPPNMTPKFFHRSPRDALRRVTSLLIRGKGGSSKESKKDTLSPSGGGFGFEDVGESSRQKRGFFKGLWKRSRGYSLDHQ